MTNDEIAKLAREYVADVYGGDTDFIDEAENVISWLLRTHCIIKKSKLGEAYYVAKYNYDNAESDRDKELALAKKGNVGFYYSLKHKGG